MKPVVFVCTRIDKNRTAVLSVMNDITKVERQVSTHVNKRVEFDGAILQRKYTFTPAPVVPGTKVRCGGTEHKPILTDADPVINCLVRETELIERDGSRTLYQIVQHCVG